jgi:hypothetical protein
MCIRLAADCARAGEGLEAFHEPVRPLLVEALQQNSQEFWPQLHDDLTSCEASYGTMT